MSNPCGDPFGEAMDGFGGGVQLDEFVPSWVRG